MLKIQDAARRFMARGWYVFPISRAKKPLCPHGRKDAATDQNMISAWWPVGSEASIAVHVGRSGLIVIDEDERGAIEGLTGQPGGELPATLTSVTARGRHMIYRTSATGLKSARLLPTVEVKAGEANVTLPPSVHASGHVYAWQQPPHEITEAPQWLVDLCTPEEDAPKAPKVRETKIVSDPEAWLASTIDLACKDVENAPAHTANETLNNKALWLGRLVAGNPSLDEDEVYARLIGAARSRIADASEVRATARSGWRKGMSEPLTVTAGVSSVSQPVSLEALVTAVAPRFPLALMKPPGLVGEIAEWMDTCATVPAPVLSIGAALSLVGCVAGQRYAAPGGARGCMYIIATAPTGGGKNNGQECQGSLLRAARLENLIGAGGISSKGGIVKALADEPVSLWRLDEFGKLLGAIQGRNSRQDLKDAGATLVRLWSDSNSRHDPDGRVMDRVDPILKPHLCVYGMSNPTSLWSNFHTESKDDGLLNRLLFVCQDDVGDQRWDKEDHNNPPADLVTAISDIGHGHSLPGDHRKGDVACVMPLHPDARAQLDAWSKEIWDTQVKAGTDDAWAWQRAREHALRVAVALGVGCSPAGGEIGVDVVDWACGFVQWSIERMVWEARDKIHTSTHGAIAAEACRWIAGQGGEVTRRDLQRRFAKRVGPRGWKETYASLCETETLSEITHETEGGGRPVIWVRLSGRV